MPNSRRVIWMMLVLNLVFWGWLAIDIAIRVEPFADRMPVFEEELPAFKFGRWAVPVEMESKSLLFNTVYTMQLPSYWTARHLIGWLNPGKTWEHRLGVLSLGACILIGTMALSFLQWYVVGFLVMRLLKRVE